MAVAPSQTENHALAAAAGDSWRSWLMTGIRRAPIYRRRVRGAHKGLKRMLVEGMTSGDDEDRRWKRFSGAMLRQAVDEAVSSLPPRQKQLIKLAYFSDLTNREIAQGLGITTSSVERGLREAVARVSEYVERGKGAGRRAIYAIGLFLAGRHLLKAGVVVVATATAGAFVSAQPAPRAQPAHVERVVSVPALISVQPYAPVLHRVVDVVLTTDKSVAHAVFLSLGASGIQVVSPGVDLPGLKLPISVKIPPLPIPPPPIPPIHQGLLRA